MPKPHVLIAGAGIGGLTAALALLKRGIDVDVYEQATELREVGAGVQLSANGTRVLYELGVGDAVASLAVEAEGKEIRHWNTGRTWKLFDLGAVSIERYGYPYFTVYRPDLLGALADAVRAIKPTAIHLESRVAGFTQTSERVTLELENGRTVSGDLLIGADGVHSRIRHALFGDDRPEFTGLMAWRGIAPMTSLPAHLKRMVGTNWVGPGGHVVHYPLRRGEIMNFVGIIEGRAWLTESWSTRGTHEECATDFAGWHADIHAMIRNLQTPFKWALMGRPPRERWTVGRVTLLGDAAHPMLPLLAQGAVMSIEDGFILARALAAYDDDAPAALLRYESARRERTKRTVLGSAENAKRFHNPTLSEPGAAEAYIDREWTEQRVAERYEWLFTYDVTKILV